MRAVFVLEIQFGGMPSAAYDVSIRGALQHSGDKAKDGVSIEIRGLTAEHVGKENRVTFRLCTFTFATVISCWVGMAVADADEFDDVIIDLQHAWAKGSYNTPKKLQEKYFADLQNKAHHMTEKFPSRVEALIWEGIITSTHARYQSIFSAAGTARKARDLLLAAEKIDPNALDGSVLTTLGCLYYKVPSGISFGDHKKARAYLERALKINPEGIDQNFFYGEFLVEDGEKNKGIEYLKKVLAAPLRPGREEMDVGRRAEAQQLLDKLSQ